MFVEKYNVRSVCLFLKASVLFISSRKEEDQPRVCREEIAKKITKIKKRLNCVQTINNMYLSIRLQLARPYTKR